MFAPQSPLKVYKKVYKKEKGFYFNRWYLQKNLSDCQFQVFHMFASPKSLLKVYRKEKGFYFSRWFLPEDC